MIDPYDEIPKYHQLARILRNKITEGEWEPQSAIPSERQLEQQYRISRPTIRQAIELLIREGYLYREHGKGTFVMPQKLQKGLLELTSFSEDSDQSAGSNRGRWYAASHAKSRRKRSPVSWICPWMEKRCESNASAWGMASPSGCRPPTWRWKKARYISQEEMEKAGSLYKILQEKFGIIPWAADETLEVTLASPEEARLLQIEEGCPLLLNERVLWSQDRKAVEYVKILYRGDRYRYTMRLTRS